MKPLSADEQLAALRKDNVRIAIISWPGMMAFGLGMLGLKEDDLAGAFSFLENDNIVYGLLLFAGVNVAWVMYRTFVNTKQKSKILEQNDI